jgi:hypothetical protein
MKIMASQPASLYGSEQKPTDFESQSSFDKLLRSRLSRFLTNPAPWKEDLRLIVEVFRERKWDAVVFGGVLRDLALYGPSERPRDVDIVANCSSSELSTWLSSFPVERTRFGGFRVRIHKWNFDIWTLHETWAFTTGSMKPTFENLPRTTFFNIEGIAAQLNAAPGHKRALYSSGFAEAISSKILDINFEPNPFPQLCIIRGLLTATRHGLLLSSRLAHYIAVRANRREIAEIMNVQFRHYGVVRLRTKDVEHWLDHIDRSLRKNPEQAVKLPNAEAQLVLPQVDHWDIS